MAKKLGINNKYPKDLYKTHEHLESVIMQRENERQAKIDARREEKLRIKNKQFKKVYKKCISLAKRIKHADLGLTLNIPQGYKEFVKVGNTLHNCVAASGYCGKVVRGECLIITVNKGGKPVECCELIPCRNMTSLRIEQMHGDHNQDDGEFHKEGRKLVNAYIRGYQAYIGESL